MNQEILIVDDNDEILASLSELLSGVGYQVHTAKNGQEALDILCAQKIPACVIIDINMPTMDGLEFARVARNYISFISVPFIFISTAKPAGVNGFPLATFLAKPFTAERVLDAIAQLTGTTAKT